MHCQATAAMVICRVGQSSTLEIDIRKKIKKNKLNFPIVVKPNNEGSSIGVKICKNFHL